MTEYSLLKTKFALSPRERELLNFLNKGCTFRECAELMNITVPAAKGLAGRAYKKLNAENMQSALFEARSVGALD